MKKTMVCLVAALIAGSAACGGSAAPVKGGEWVLPGLNTHYVYVAPGSFEMGSNEADSFDSEKPVHQVTISRGFWLGKYETTQNEYLLVMGSNPSYFSDDGRRPVEQVSWNDAVEFCRKLTEREQTAGRLPEGYEYRLPTEAEWEFAARGGAKSSGYKYSGGDNLDAVGWYYENSGSSRQSDSAWNSENLKSNNCQTHPVGSKAANELGIYDMSGNVWEWCYDYYGKYGSEARTDPVGSLAGPARVFRGGSWGSRALRCRAVNRFRTTSAATREGGFRVALAPRIAL